MSGALIPLSGDRPAVIRHGTGWVYVSVHDAAYRDQRTHWRGLLAKTHPDGSGSGSAFLRTHRRYKAWQASELQWYARYGLEPPPLREVPRSHVPPLLALERDALREAIQLCGGVIVRAAAVLELNRQMFKNRAWRHGLIATTSGVHPKTIALGRYPWAGTSSPSIKEPAP